MGYSYRLSGGIAILPPPEWAELKRSGFLDHGDRDLLIVPTVNEADDGRKTVLHAAAQGGRDEPRCYDVEDELCSMVETFPGRTWSGFIDAVGEDGTDHFRLFVEDGTAKLARPTITWPEGVR